MKKIKHQKQPTDNSCVSTCIAMILGLDVKSIIGEFHDGFMSHEIDVREYLSNHGVKATPKLSNDNMIMPGGLYMLTVPSLNKVAINHEILIDIRDIDNIQLYDPNFGKSGKKYYVYDEDPMNDCLGVNLQSWFIDYEIEFDK